MRKFFITGEWVSNVLHLGLAVLIGAATLRVLLHVAARMI